LQSALGRTVVVYGCGGGHGEGCRRATFNDIYFTAFWNRVLIGFEYEMCIAVTIASGAVRYGAVKMPVEFLLHCWAGVTYIVWMTM
jgi:hypothetical protein